MIDYSYGHWDRSTEDLTLLRFAVLIKNIKPIKFLKKFKRYEIRACVYNIRQPFVHIISRTDAPDGLARKLSNRKRNNIPLWYFQ